MRYGGSTRAWRNARWSVGRVNIGESNQALTKSYTLRSWPKAKGGGFSPQSGSPGGGLTPTYRTPNAKAFPIGS